MKLTYRPEIDGLRAIAVGAVILYHAKIPIINWQGEFRGGFIGVDIFFVISGYLITSIILKELVTTGSFSFKYFYERRIRRILPALLFVMLASLPFVWMYLLPSVFVDFSKSILYSLGFSSNFYFHYSGQEYGALDVFFKPFLHTWSLSVEEQYYILFPVVLLITFKYFRKYLIHILILGFLLSLGLAEWTSRNYPSISFYFLHTRMWELLAGSILAYFEITLGHRSKNKTLNLILPTIGLLLIGHSILFFNDKMFHPSFYTLSPIIGVCLIIWFSSKNELITKILSTKLFVGIGLISYSLYLWHYPIFSLLKINGFIAGNLFLKIIIIPIIFTLSIFTYKFIEIPFRNKKVSFKKVLTIISLSYLLLIFINLTILTKNGFPNRFKILKEVNQFYNPDNYFLSKISFNNVNINKNKFDKNKYKILVIGDSHGQDLFSALSQTRDLYERPLDVLYISETLYKSVEKYRSLLSDSDMIIFSSRFDTYNKLFLENNIKMLKEINKNIYLTSNVNEYRVYSKFYTLLDHKIIFDDSFSDYFGLKNYYYDNRTVHSFSEKNLFIKELSRDLNIKYLNKEDFMCEIKKKECFYVDEIGNKLMFDHNHFTREGAEFFGRKIFEINWLKLN